MLETGDKNEKPVTKKHVNFMCFLKYNSILQLGSTYTIVSQTTYGLGRPLVAQTILTIAAGITAIFESKYAKPTLLV